MKRQNITTIVLTVLFSMVGIIASAHDIAIANADGKTIYYVWANDNHTELAVSCEGSSYYSSQNEYSGNVVIPASVTNNGTTYLVTRIGDDAFRDCSDLTSVTIPSSVTSIGASAFFSCRGLTSVTISDGVTSIDNSAFGYCSSLTSVTIPNSVTSIGAYAFSGCSCLTSVTIPGTLTSLGDGAFSGSSDLTSVNVVVTDYAAFCSNRLLTQIKNKVKLPVVLLDADGREIKQFVVPEGVTTISSNAFFNCTGLTSFTLASTVTEIGLYPFYGCTNLRGVKVVVTDLAAFCHNNIVRLMYGADFPVLLIDRNGWEITSITIPSSVTSIGNHAFTNCIGLKSVIIGNTVTSIGDLAFFGCTALNTINIPSSLSSIGSGAFMGTAWFENQPDGVVYIGKVALTYKGTMPDDTSITLLEGTVGIAAGAFEGSFGLTSITIPNSVKSIGDGAFYCSMLTSINIPSSLTAIGSSVFLNCSSLTSIEIPSSVTSIGENAFASCSALTSITIPNSVTSIGDFAFADCDQLRTLFIGSGVSSIGNYAFGGILELTDVYCYAENVPTTNSHAFEESNFGATLHVPTASAQAYSRTEPWTYFATVEAGVEIEKCATPTIAFVDDKLSFTCATEGVQYVYSMSSDDIRTNDDNDNALSTRFRVSVYATKEGHANSDVATIDITYSGQKGDVNGDGKITISDAVGIVDIILGGDGPAPETHEYVDLKLPSGTLWATCNIGADTPEDYGYYFAWGETVPYAENGKTNFDWSTYQWCSGSPTTLSKYNPSESFGIVDNLTVLEVADDAASANWGSAWRMPTEEQYDELINSSYTTVEWTQENNVYGCKITSNTNGKYIFLPAAGVRSYSMLGYAGSKGYYWSNTLGSDYPSDSYYLNFDSSGCRTDGSNRFEGRSVRPVRASTTSTNP